VRVLFVKQDHASPAGLVGEAFAGLGYEVSEFTVVPRERYHSPDVTVTFPDPLAYDAIVAFGAAWAVYDVAAIGAWIGDEIAFTRQAIAGGVPVLGICFGGQMLAAALGGQVSRASQPEIGWNVIESDDPGLIDPGPWFQWHFDRFELPAGIPMLARTALANQVFTAGRSLGLQFHPELTPSVLECWLDVGGEAQLTAQGVGTAALLAQTRSLAGAAAIRTRELVRRFVRNVATARIVAPEEHLAAPETHPAAPETHPA
jgi:GMP synthase-like glutamine amidotransferase